MDVLFFETPAEFRAWLAANHASSDEQWVGFRKRHTGQPSLTWPESVDAALCFGWIDGLRKSLGEDSYAIRFAPRRPNSIWSAINIARVEELTRLGLMQPAGLAAYELRDPARSAIYSYERASAALSDDEVAQFQANPAAWDFWQRQPPGYRRTITHWVASAKRPATRAARLAGLISDSANGRRRAEVTYPRAVGS